MDTIEHALAEALQVSKRTWHEKPLVTRDFVTAQMIDSYCREVATTVGNLGSVYMYDQAGVLISQSKIDGIYRRSHQH